LGAPVCRGFGKSVPGKLALVGLAAAHGQITERNYSVAQVRFLTRIRPRESATPSDRVFRINAPAKCAQYYFSLHNILDLAVAREIYVQCYISIQNVEFGLFPPLELGP